MRLDYEVDFLRKEFLECLPLREWFFKKNIVFWGRNFENVFIRESNFENLFFEGEILKMCFWGSNFKNLFFEWALFENILIGFDKDMLFKQIK